MNQDICYSYSTETWIYGSKTPESKSAARGQGLFKLPYIPGNHAITVYPKSDWLQITKYTHARRHHSNRGYKLETMARVNETARTFACSLTALACPLGPAGLEMLIWQHLHHSSH